MNRLCFCVCLLTTSLFVGCHSAPDHSVLIEETFIQSGLPLAVLGSSTSNGNEQFESFSDDGQVGPDSVFEIASMTKAMTATAVMQLVEEGKINLDTPIANYLPEIKEINILNEDLTTRPEQTPITMRHLLTHTAGFGYCFNSPKIARAIGWNPNEESWPQPEVIPEGEYDWGFGGLQPRRVFEAGEKWHYGRNLGIAGRVVERVSGMDLDSYFKKNIFKPLGMNRSGYNLPEHIRADQVQMVMRNPITGTFIPMPSMRAVPMKTFYGGGELLSTPRDYLRFLTCLAKGGAIDGVRILSESSVDTFFTNQLPEGLTTQYPEDDSMRRTPDQTQRSFLDDDDQFSLAWAIEANPNELGNRPQGIGYWSGIFNTYYTIDRTNGVVVVAFMQLLPFNDAMAYELYRVHEDRVYSEL